MLAAISDFSTRERQTMSAPHSPSHPAPSNSNDRPDLPFAPTLRKILIVMGIGFIVPIVLLLMVAFYVGSGSRQAEGTAGLSSAAVEARVAPAASAVAAASSQAAAQANAASMATAASSAQPGGAGAQPVAAAAAKPDGKALYESTCIACHGTGVAGAPKFGDKAVWAPIIAQGTSVLYDRAIHGYTGKRGMMPPKGGSTASDDDVKAAVDYIVANSK